MDWKHCQSLVCLLLLATFSGAFCACAGSETNHKSEIPVGSPPEEAPAETAQEAVPTEVPAAASIEEDFQEQGAAAANLTDAESTDYPSLEVETFAGSGPDTFLKCKCGRQGEQAEAPFDPFKTRQDIEGEGLPVAPLIINGEATGEHEFKWMVGIAKKRIHDPPGAAARVICGATLINNKFLLTAAHCISKYYLLFRSYSLTDVFLANYTGLIGKAKRFIPHPRWNIKTVANDIGLIELEEPIDFAKEPNIRPACLPTPIDGDFAGQEGIAVGWGYTKPKGAMATVLQKVTLPVMSHNDCAKTRYSAMVTPSMVCAGYQEGEKDACTNDSGGPLTIKTSEGYHKVIGVTSWGHGCAQPNAPGVYTRVTKYLNWILSVVRGSEWCTPKSV